MKRLTVATSLAIIASCFYFPSWNVLDKFKPLLGILAGIFLCGALLLVSLCTLDSLVVEKSEKVLIFQRKGILINESKKFKLSQISDLRLQQSITYSKFKAVISYKLQVVLISTKIVDLFRSFEKKQIRESVGLSNPVCSIIRVFRTPMEPSPTHSERGQVTILLQLKILSIFRINFVL